LDNITHSLVGWTLGQTGLKTKTRKGLAVLILGANMPDIDVFLGWVPWASLATHRGWTHSLAGGVLLMPPILAGLLWVLDRWQVRRGTTFKSGLVMHFGWLVVLSYLGTLTHPLLDWQTVYAIQLFSPFDRRWYHTDTLFIIDLWIWLALGAAIALSKWREGRGGGRWQWPPRIALAAVLAYLGLNSVITDLARTAVLAQPDYPDPDVVVASPPPLAFWHREMIWREEGLIWRGEFDPRRSPTDLEDVRGPTPDGMDDPWAREAMHATPEAERFVRWSILPVAYVVYDAGCHVTVNYYDARFGDSPVRNRLGASVIVLTHAPGC